MPEIRNRVQACPERLAPPARSAALSAQADSTLPAVCRVRCRIVVACCCLEQLRHCTTRAAAEKGSDRGMELRTMEGHGALDTAMP